MINLNKVKRYSVKARYSKVRARDFAAAPARGRSFRGFWDSLPEILKAGDLRRVVDAVVAARRKKKGVILMAGAHVIKCGLNPVIIELLKKGVVSCLCLNGAGVIHDFELALQARTSEDVASSLADGSFGMARQTADFINQAVSDGVREGLGLGSAVSSRIAGGKLPFKKLSLLAAASACGVPVCVFVALGTDIIHQHPTFDAGLTAEGSYRDFRCLAEQVLRLDNGGVVLNFGSAVIMPEVFLKALNLARNLGGRVRNFTAANFDMLIQYRSLQNIVTRPVLPGGEGYYILGHHEIMIPLFAQAVCEKI